MPIRNWALVGNSTQNRTSSLRLLNGTFGVLGVGTLYPELDHLTVGGTVDSVNFYNNCYGGRYDHLYLGPATASEAAMKLQNNSGLVQASWLTMFPGYYGLMLLDSGGVFSQMFITPGLRRSTISTPVRLRYSVTIYSRKLKSILRAAAQKYQSNCMVWVPTR